MTLIGCDPELFVVGDNGGIVPVCGMLGGTKEEPLSVTDGTLQEDNVCAEVGIEPCSQVGNAVARTLSVVRQLTDRIKHQVTAMPGHVFSMDQLDDERAWLFGCSPDYNAYTGGCNRRPRITDGRRYAGGHLHFSCSVDDVREVVQLADIILGIPSVLMDSDTERRKVYGMAGAHRIKPYGGEYRVLSNFWLQTPELMEWAYEGIMRAVRDVDTLHVLHSEVPPDVVRRTINTHDKRTAEEICQALTLQLP